MQWQWHVNGVSGSTSSSVGDSGSEEWNVEDETWIVRHQINNNDDDDGSDSGGGDGSWAKAHVTEEVLLLVLLLVVVVMLFAGAHKFGLLGNMMGSNDQGSFYW